MYVYTHTHIYIYIYIYIYTFSLTQRGWSPLHLAVDHSEVSDAHVQIVERLLAAGADPNKIVEDGDNVCTT